jgi:hypothetical protein
MGDKIEVDSKEKEVCEYKLSEKEAPYPRVAWVCLCGFYLVLMEGYKFDVDGGRTDVFIDPSGKCMKCGKELERKP